MAEEKGPIREEDRYLRYLEARACEAEVLAASQEALFNLVRELEKCPSVSAVLDLLEHRLRSLLPLGPALLVMRDSPSSDVWRWRGAGANLREGMSLSPKDQEALRSLEGPASVLASQIPGLAPGGAESFLAVPVTQGGVLWGGVGGSPLPSGVFRDNERRLAGILALHLGLRLESMDQSRRREEEAARLKKDLALAAAAQRSMRPPEVLRWPEGVAAIWTRPLGEVGGDACDLLRDSAGKVHLLLADAMGHGVAAGLLVTFLRGLFFSRLLRESLSPEELASLLDEGLKSVAGDSDDAPFCTVIHGVWDPRKKVFSYLSAAGAPAFILRSSGEMVALDSTMPLLGVLPVEPEGREVEGSPGDVVCFCSDGLLEALPLDESQSPRSLLAAWLQGVLREGDPSGVPALVQKEVSEGRWVPRDDATLVLLSLGAGDGG